MLVFDLFYYYSVNIIPFDVPHISYLVDIIFIPESEKQATQKSQPSSTNKMVGRRDLISGRLWYFPKQILEIVYRYKYLTKTPQKPCIKQVHRKMRSGQPTEVLAMATNYWLEQLVFLF